MCRRLLPPLLPYVENLVLIIIAVGMLACGLDVKITFNIPLTVLSAVVAIIFTFAAFSTGYASECIGTALPATALSLGKSLRAAFQTLRRPSDLRDPETGGLPGDDIPDERMPILGHASDHGDEDEDDEEGQRNEHDPEWRHRSQYQNGLLSHDSAESGVLGYSASSPAHAVHFPPQDNIARRHHIEFPTPPLPPSTQRDPQEPSSSRTSEDSTPLTTDSSDDSVFGTRRMSTSSSSQTLSGTTLSTRSWSEPLHAGLSRETRLRIRAQARDKPVPKFGWRYWVNAYWKSITLFVGFRAAIWGLAIVFMHYCGT